MKKKIRKNNSKQVSFAEKEFYDTSKRGKSYQSTLDLLDGLKLKLRKHYNHLLFTHPSLIFEIEKTLMMLMEELP